MDWVGKKIAVVFDDGNGVSRKIGFVLKIDSHFVFLKMKDSEEAIALNKIIRMEVISDGRIG